jgi:hypothetical protein
VTGIISLSDILSYIALNQSELTDEANLVETLGTTRLSPTSISSERSTSSGSVSNNGSLPKNTNVNQTQPQPQQQQQQQKKVPSPIVINSNNNNNRSTPPFNNITTVIEGNQSVFGNRNDPIDKEPTVTI